MDIKTLKELQIPTIAVSNKWKNYIALISEIVNVSEFVYGKEIVFYNPNVENESRLSCLKLSVTSTECEKDLRCKSKKANKYLTTYQTTTAVQSYLVNLGNLYHSAIKNGNNEEALFLKSDYEALFESSNGEIKLKKPIESFCEHKGDIIKLENNSLFQAPTFVGKYYYLKGLYHGRGLSRCVCISPEEDPSLLIFTSRPFNPSLDSFTGISEAAKSGYDLLCDNTMVSIYNMEFKLYGEEIPFNEHFFL
jgi:hypothetical protein